jgi:hypothetical protein
MGSQKPRRSRRSHQCEKVKADGKRCQANAQAGSRWCFFHDPAKAQARTEARRAGGSATRAASLPADTPDVLLGSVADVSGLLAQTINQVRRGDVDARIANCVGYLAGQMLTALEKGEIEQRIAALEERVNAQYPRPRRMA